MAFTLYLRTDDVGLSLGTNAAVEAATLTCPNIGLMAVCPAIEEAAERFRRRDDLCLGLHFTLNAEWDTVKWSPLSPPEQVPSLIQPDGFCFPNPWRLPAGVVYDPAHVLLELKAQLARLRGLGLAIRYLDSHMAVLHTHPELKTLARHFADEEGLFCPDDLPHFPHGGYGEGLEADLTRWAGLLDGATGECGMAVFHPSQADGVMETLTSDPSMLRNREAEHALLSSPRFAALLREKKVSTPPFLPPH